MFVGVSGVEAIDLTILSHVRCFSRCGIGNSDLVAAKESGKLDKMLGTKSEL